MRCDDVKCEGGEGVEVSYMIPGDGVPLWVWRGTTDIPASPKAIFERLWHYRYDSPTQPYPGFRYIHTSVFGTRLTSEHNGMHIAY